MEKSGRPQLNSPVWLDLFPATEPPTRSKVKRISRRMKAKTIPRTAVRSIPATVLAVAEWRKKLPKISISPSDFRPWLGRERDYSLIYWQELDTVIET